MAKKLPLLILTLTISTLVTTVPTPSFAEGSPTAMWSLEEIAALKAEIDAEEELTCGDSPECRKDLRMERLNSGNSIYRAVERLNTSNFLVSAINPSAETISLYFQDEDYMLKRMGINERRNLTELYMYWLEDGMIGPAKDTIVIYNYSEDVKNGTHIDGLHPLISKNEEKDGENWLPPHTEVQYSVAGSDLINNREGILYFTVNASGLIIGLKDYSACTNSPDYTEGMECRLMFNESGYYSYAPMPPKTTAVPSEEPTPEPASNPDELISETPVEPGKGSAGEDSEPKEMADNTETNPKLEIASSVSYTTHYNPPKAPNTGTYPAEVCSREINMPWWIIALILAGNTLLIWWFIPNRHHSHRKPQKSPKKS